MKKRLVSLSLLIGTGLSVPALAAPPASGIADRQVSLRSEAGVIAQTSSEDTLPTPTDSSISPTTTSEIRAEARNQLTSTTPSREYVFTGNANEIVVVYIEEDNGREYWIDLLLSSPSAQRVNRANRYPDGLNFSESEGRHLTFLLPETGEYRFTLAAEDYTRDSELTETPLSYALKIRVASYEERLVMHGSDLLDEERYESAIATFDQAIAYNPNIPIAYFMRAVSYAGVAIQDTGIDENDIDDLEDIYTLFQSMDSDKQALVASDIRQLGQRLSDAVAAGEVTTEQIDIDPQIFMEVVEFLETGEQSEALIEFIEE